jgi:hypothetical protein
MAYVIKLRASPAGNRSTAFSAYAGLSSTVDPESVELTGFGSLFGTTSVLVSPSLQYIWLLWPTYLGRYSVVVDGFAQDGSFTTPDIVSSDGVDCYRCRSNQRLTATDLVLSLGAL